MKDIVFSLPRLVVTYAVTEDNFNGTPWMPDGDGFWAVVSRLRGRTQWRRIFLDFHHQTSSAPQALGRPDDKQSSA